MQFIPVSAKTGEGLADIEAAISLLAESMPHLLLAPPPSPSAPVGAARGFVLEAKVDKHRGRMLQVIVRSGYLREGAWVAVGPRYGRIKKMYIGAPGGLQGGLQGAPEPVKVAGMNQAVEIGGLGDLQVSAGQLVVQARTQQQAARLAAMAERAMQLGVCCCCRYYCCCCRCCCCCCCLSKLVVVGALCTAGVIPVFYPLTSKSIFKNTKSLRLASACVFVSGTPVPVQQKPKGKKAGIRKICKYGLLYE